MGPYYGGPIQSRRNCYSLPMRTVSALLRLAGSLSAMLCCMLLCAVSVMFVVVYRRRRRRRRRRSSWWWLPRSLVASHWQRRCRQRRHRSSCSCLCCQFVAAAAAPAALRVRGCQHCQVVAPAPADHTPPPCSGACFCQVPVVTATCSPPPLLPFILVCVMFPGATSSTASSSAAAAALARHETSALTVEHSGIPLPTPSVQPPT